MSSPSLILLCEDSREDAFLLRHAFAKAGLSHVIVDVRNGQQAINYLTGGALFDDRQKYPLPALVLLDLRMPLMDGFGVLAWLNTRPELKSIPVVVLAASKLPEDIQKAVTLGTHDYFVKPQDWPEWVTLAKTLHERWINKASSTVNLISTLANPRGEILNNLPAT
jgi:CheY-like chemotaxis protein